ncbi:MAG: hypothetical protein HQK77_12600 [Desulfobacterales bacterium]|nr:hypothetical protein [Desulfobacterales bacterium]
MTDISEDIRMQMETNSIHRVGICPDYNIVVAEINGNIVCSEIMETFCSKAEICLYNAQEAAPNIVQFLCSDPITQRFSKHNAVTYGKAKDISTKELKKRKTQMDRQTKLAFDKLKFELTKRVAAEAADMKALEKALMEEFGISTVPNELIAVFNTEIKKNMAKRAGLSYSEFLLKEAGKKKKRP